MKKLLEVQKEIGTLSKNAKNPFFKSQYLDLSELLTHVTPILNKHGLILLQPIKSGEVGSVLIDAETGNKTCESWMTLPETISDPQKMGACVTYFRRYTLKSLLSIAEVDDDGNTAAKKPTKAEIERIIENATDKATLTKWREWISHFGLVDIATTKAGELT